MRLGGFVTSLLPKWHQLARIGRSRVVGLTILMPFFGYMIIFNDYFIQWLSISSSYLPPSLFERGASGDLLPADLDVAKSRLFAIYYGLTFLGVGTVCYSIACPELIKVHPSRHEYVRESLHLLTRYQARKMMDELKESVKKPSGLEGLIEQMNSAFDLLAQRGHKESSSEFESTAKDLMLEYWDSINTNQAIGRFFT
ncbi:MAG: hypothetical protein ACSHXK_16885, partial [Oceanococcus sp.]